MWDGINDFLTGSVMPLSASRNNECRVTLRAGCYDFFCFVEGVAIYGDDEFSLGPEVGVFFEFFRGGDEEERGFQGMFQDGVVDGLGQVSGVGVTVEELEAEVG